MVILWKKEKSFFTSLTIPLYKSKELETSATCAKNAQVQKENATKFRQWANKVLKEYLLRGYAINQRIERLEQRVTKTEEKIVAEHGEVDEIVKNLYTDCKKSLQFLEIFKS